MNLLNLRVSALLVPFFSLGGLLFGQQPHSSCTGRSFLKTFRFIVLVLLVLLAATPVRMAAQAVSGDLSGTVLDATGAAVPQATVTVVNEATGVENATTTTNAGDYHLANLPAGAYDIAVNAPGFSKAEIRAVQVQLNQTVTRNVTLQIGQTTTTVEVTTAAVAIDTTTAQVQSTFDTKQSTDLPTASMGTGVLNLSLLSAGVASSGSVGQGMGPSVGGQRPTNNNFTLEGVDINDKSITGPVVTVPNDAVAEFSVLQNQFSPEFGHSSGGQFNVIMKSGGNDFHGSLYEYFQNRNLDAGDTISPIEGNPLHPRFDENRFGGTFGGPIKKNKLFFFVNYEYNPTGQTASTFYNAPTAAGYATLAGMPGINQTNLQQFQKYLGAAPSPNVGTVAVGAGNESLGTGVFAPGSTVAPTAIPVGVISESLPNYVNSESAVAAIDYSISDKDSLRGRFVLNRSGASDTNGFPQAFFTTDIGNSYVVTAEEYHTFGPTLTNELRLGYNRLYVDFPVTNQTFPGLDAFPNIDVYELNAGFGPDDAAPQYRIQNTYSMADNVSWTKGAHSFKFGFDGWKSISPSVFLQRSRGDYEWSYLSDYLYDNNPDGVAERSLGSGAYSGDQVLLGFFANDQWKIRPNFTLNLGLRYEYLTLPYTERLQTLNSIANVPGLIEFNEPKPQTTDFMPRVGIAYSPGNSGNTSIRAGFGINYDILYDNLGTLSKPPEFSTTIDVTGLDQSGFLAGGGIPANAPTGTLDAATARSLTSGYVPNQKRPEAIQWNFGVQHVFAQNYTFEARYLGSRGLFLPVQDQLNRQPVVNANNALPVYLTAPSQSVLNGLTSNLANLESSYNNGGFIPPGYLNAGFINPIAAFMPIGNSTYHGLATQLTRRFSNGLQFLGAYTWSHNIDDSTATSFTTISTPRRPEDSQNLSLDRSDSALDHRQRLTAEVIYDVPFFKHGNWFMRNLVGNWEVAPIYTYQTGTLYTPQSAVDSNLNGDSAPDRVFVNPGGVAGTGSAVTPLTNSNGDVVAYLATNPNARYIQSPLGTLPNSARNLLHVNPINDIDMSIAKRFDVKERFKMEFSARALNVFNHPQYTGGFLSDIAQSGQSSNLVREATEPQNSLFEQWSQVFSSNPRGLQLALKFIF